jgi:hypothetical protein
MVFLNDRLVKHYRVQLTGGLVRWRSSFAAFEHNPTSAQAALVLGEVNKSSSPWSNLDVTLRLSVPIAGTHGAVLRLPGLS